MINYTIGITRRLRSVLPARWFGATTPVLDTLLTALAVGWTAMFDLLRYTGMQTRIASASDVWLDIVAYDFFGSRLRRSTGQSDRIFRLVIRRNIFCPMGTRTALIVALHGLTGRAPLVFEPRNTSDTGGYGNMTRDAGGGVGYGTAGGWGNLSLPFQCFVTAFRPQINGVANLSGWNLPEAGYGVGALEYAGLETANGYIGDGEILAEMTRVAPVGAVIWANISS